MAQARDEAGNIWDVTDPNNPVLVQQAQQSGRQASIFQDPYAEPAERRREQDQQFEAERLRIAQQNAEIAAQRAMIDAQIGQMNIQQGQRELTDAQREIEDFETVTAQKDIRQRLRMGNVLENVRRVRDIAEQGGTGWQSLLSAVPESSARELEAALRPIRATLAFDRLQEMRDESKTGGALGAVSEKELALLEGAVAALDAGVSKGSFLDSLDQIERHFVGSQLALSGIDPESEQGRTFYGEYGVDLPQEGRALNQRQRNVFDAVMEANPDATPEQLRSIFEAAGVPAIGNLDEVVEARRAGLGVSGEDVPSYQDSLLGQGMSGVNEGIADILGFPVDMMAGAMNLGSQGINALTNSSIPQIEDPVLGSQWIRDVTGDLTGGGLIYDPTDDPTSQFARRVGQSIGSASVPVGAMAGTARQAGAGMLAATGGGIGGATAQQVAPGNIGAEIAAELLGGGLTGGGLAMARRGAAQREIESAIPTTQELRGQANELYSQAERRGVTATPDHTEDLAERMRQVLRDEGQLGPSGRISDADSSTSKALNLVEQYEGRSMTPTEMNTIRRVIADGRGSIDSSDRRIASLLLNEFDDFVAPLAPEFQDARRVASRYLTAEDLEQARELAAAQAGQFTGSGFENALRTQYRGLDRANIRGRAPYPDPVVEAIQDVSRGTPASNAARAVGRFAPTGVVSAGLGGGVPAMIGTAMGGPLVGGAMGAAAMGLGAAGRTAATRMGTRNADIAELIARSGGPIEQAPLLDEPSRNLVAAILAGQMAGID